MFASRSGLKSLFATGDLRGFFAPELIQVASTIALFTTAIICIGMKSVLGFEGFDLVGQTLLAISLEAMATNLWISATDIMGSENAYVLANLLLLANLAACTILIGYLATSLKWRRMLVRSTDVADLSLAASKSNQQDLSSQISVDSITVKR